MLFLLVQSADHISPATGLTPTVTISKNGGAFATPAGAVSEVGNGWYKVAPNAADASALGPLVLHATAGGADPTDEQFDVVLSETTATGAAVPVSIGSITARALITSAYRLLGIGAGGETISSELAADGLIILSEMLDAWSAERLTIYAQSRTVHALTIGVQRYTIGGSLADFTEARPLWIDGVSVLVNGQEYRPRPPFSRDKWASVYNKSQAGVPIGMFYNPTYPLGEIDVWPVPDAAASLVIYAPAASLVSVSSLATNISAPQGWARALRYNLAIELAPGNGVEPLQAVVTGAIESKATIQRVNVLMGDELRIDPALLPYGGVTGWSISAGDFR